MFFDLIWEIISSPKYMSTILEGFSMTVIIACGAAVLGLVLGIIVAVVKIAAKKNKKLKVFEVICDLYVSIIRGTPVALQLFILAFGILTIRGFPLEITAIIAFGINSGAYVAESLRDKALMDNDYAANGYAHDMEQEAIYAQARARLAREDGP